jgi:hypothetical protein
VTNPALTALAVLDVVERHRRNPDAADRRTEELRAVLVDPDDDLVHADHVVDVAVELAGLMLQVSDATGYRLAEFVADYRRLLARVDDV